MNANKRIKKRALKFDLIIVWIISFFQNVNNVELEIAINII